MAKSLEELGGYISDSLGSSLSGFAVAHEELTLEAVREDIVKVLTFLRDDPKCRFVCFIDICGADYPERERRFDVVYHLLSPEMNTRIRIRVTTDEETPVPSTVSVYPASDWFEREAYDLYGMLFSGHPDLRRLLTDYGFQGHPLRKDFPLTGYVEVRYDDEAKKVVYEPVKLMQGFRNFDFMSPWEGMDDAIPGDEKAGLAAEKREDS
ncbi:NADH-quinone oxidoreductase subunit C [Methyloligella sp. 2.7D]|uniref:NADH-quinone oxidoreductase subunit C n=1 Tax=unclassified Methyloligella TaxID=2625955 RepID=UPI00157D050D|nr:NADH-quinone oxidoreductase subunit C [Methyloligella sp. GL2]QKP77548.1 NADH-quinone oxidoreductase subunit C [Methyloligella sp. GL2]